MASPSVAKAARLSTGPVKQHKSGDLPQGAHSAQYRERNKNSYSSLTEHTFQSQLLHPTWKVWRRAH